VKAASRPAKPAAWSVLDLAEGFHLAHALRALEQAGILESLHRPAAVRGLAARHRVDGAMLEAVLQMLASRTNLIAKRAGKYRVTRNYDAHARFMVDQYLGAYGGNAVQLGRILRDPSAAEKFIDRRQHAKAFAQASTLGADVVGDLVVRLGLDHVLDLGCGAGALLHVLAARRRAFVGWGVDINPWMCAAARRRGAAARAARRIAIYRGDCRDLGAVLPPAVVAQVRAITAASLANEFFARDGAAAVAWLAGLKAMFPGRIMLIADYYGRLGAAGRAARRQILLHDFVQVISGQGVPPAGLGAWKRIYRAAKCDLVGTIEDRAASFFVHILRLCRAGGGRRPRVAPAQPPSR
jgi:SAM-dependent methyltransferase